MNFIKSINSKQINELIQAGSQRIILSMPGVFVETAKQIIDKYKAGFKNIKVIINCSEQLIRQGFGEIKAIEELKENGIQVYDQPENLVSFIIVDEQGYFLFPQSRIFLEESHNVKNAIAMDPFSMEQLVGIFFPPKPEEKKQFEDKMTNALIASSERIKNIDTILIESSKHKVFLLNESTFAPVKKAIEANPPMHPDLKRQLEYYTTNFLWIELKFKGANISSKTISIPKHVLPINSDDLRKKLSSQLKLFENIENSTWYYQLKKITDDVKKLRKTYLTPVTAKDGKNIILKTNFLNFKKKIESLKSDILTTTEEVKQKLNKEIENTKERFIKVLMEYYKKYPTDELKKTPTTDKKKALETFVEFKVGSIDFPNAEELLIGFSLSTQEFELTEQDLRNEKLIEELKGKKILTDEKVKQLGTQSKGFQATLF
jgi:hypothetical protein